MHGVGSMGNLSDPLTRSRSVLDEAEDALTGGDFARAERLLDQAGAGNARDFRTLNAWAYLLSNTDRRDQAIAAYRRALLAKPDAFDATVNLAMLLAQKHDPEAEKLLRGATQLKVPKPQQARAWLGLGDVLAETNAAEAEHALRESIRLDPKAAEPHLELAHLSESKQQYDAAEAELKAALAVNGRSVTALTDLVRVSRTAAHLPLAEATLREALKRDPGNTSARVQLGRVLAFEHKREEALAELEQAAKESGDAVALSDLAMMHADAGRLDQAAAEYRALLAKEPDDAAFHYGLANVLRQQQKFSEAEREYYTASGLRPEMVDAYQGAAELAAQRKDYGVALKLLETRAQHGPETAASCWLRAEAYDAQQQAAKAAEFYRCFLTLTDGTSPQQEAKAKERLAAGK